MLRFGDMIPLPYLPQDTSGDEFRRWKLKRRELVDSIDKVILSYSDEELSNIIDNWEIIGRDNLEFTKPLSIMYGLMHLSIFYHYHSSYARIRDLIPMIQQLTTHSNRCTCRIAARCLWWFARDSPATIDFFNNVVSETQGWLKSGTCDSSTYAAFCLLHNAYGFCDPLVNGIVRKNFQLLFNACHGSDVELQMRSISVMKHYLMTQRPDNFQAIFNLCINNLASRNERAIYGAMFLIRYFFRFCYIVDSENVLQAFLKSNITDSLVTPATEFLMELQNANAVDYKKDTFIKCFLLLLPRERVNIFKITKKIPQYSFPCEQVAESVKGLVKSNVPYGYFMLALLFKQKPSFSLNYMKYIKCDPTFCKGFCKLLKHNFSLVIRFKSQIQQFCKQQFSQPQSITFFLNALRILKYCGTSIFDNKDYVMKALDDAGKATNVDVRKAVVKTIAQYDKFNSGGRLIMYALFDQSAEVRLCAAKRLKSGQQISELRLVPQLLSDTYIDVIITVFPVIMDMAIKNPIIFFPALFKFIRQIDSTFRGMSDFAAIANYSELFPLAAKLTIKSFQEYACDLARTCIMFLSHGEITFGNSDSFISPEHLKPLSMLNPPTIRSEIFKTIYQKHIDRRDQCLLQAMRILSPLLGPVLDESLHVTFRIIRTTHNPLILGLAISCVRRLTPLLPPERPLNDILKEILPVLFEKLSNTDLGKEIAVKILKLLGSTATSALPIETGQADATVGSSYINSRNFAFKWLMQTLINSLKESHSTSMFDTITQIYRDEPESILPYTERLLPFFIKAMSEAQGKPLEQHFINLKTIIIAIGDRIGPFANQIVKICNNNITMKISIECMILLSSLLFYELTPLIKDTFERLASTVSNYPFVLMKPTLKLLSYMVFYQGMSLPVFLGTCSNIIEAQPSSCIGLIVIREVVRIVQNYTVISSYGATLSRLYMQLFQLVGPDSSADLLYSLIFSGALSTQMARMLVSSLTTDQSQIVLQLYENINALEHIPVNGKLPDFVKQKRMTQAHMKKLHRTSAHVVNPAFSELRKPETISKWVIDLSNDVVTRSPMACIRMCAKIVTDSQTFRRAILPVAFYTCWTNAAPELQQKFIQQLNRVFQLDGEFESVLYMIVDLLEMNGVDHGIPNQVLAERSDSPGRTIFYWRREYAIRKTPIQKLLMESYYRGRISTAHGILRDAGSKLDLKEKSMWYERVSDWESALEIYRKQNDNVSVIRCLGNLEKWDEIRTMYPAFNGMTKEEKEQSSLWFACAFYYVKDMRTVSELLTYFPHEETLKHYFIRGLFCVRTGKYDELKNLIHNAFLYLASNRDVFSGLNLLTAQRYLVFSQHLVELGEVVDIKVRDDEKPPHTWERRLDSFSGRGRDWRELSDVRNLLLPAAENASVAMKMAVALRKERRWAILSGMQRRLLASSFSPETLLERFKAQWAMGKRAEAIDHICFLVSSYDIANNIKQMQQRRQIPRYNFVDFMKQISNESRTELNRVYKAVHGTNADPSFSDAVRFWSGLVQTHPLSQEMNAKFIRTMAAWKIREESFDIQGCLSVQRRLKDLYPLLGKDRHAHMYFGMANIFLLDNGYEGVSEASKNAIEGLMESMDFVSLVYLIYVITKYAPDELIQSLDVSKIRKSLLIRALPQFILMARSERECVRRFSENILLDIGVNDVQSIVYWLPYLSVEIGYQISLRHADVVSDAYLFCCGMEAVTHTVLDQLLGLVCDSIITFEHGKSDKFKNIKEIIELGKPEKEINLFHKKLASKLSGEFKDLINSRTPLEIYNNLCNLRKILMNMKRSMDYIFLPLFNKELDTRESMLVSIPGKPTVNIERVDSRIRCYNHNSQQRIVKILGNDGVFYKCQVIDANVCRDHRVLQLISIINNVFKKARLGVTCQEFSAVPLSSTVGMTSMEKDAELLYDVVSGFSSEREKELEAINEVVGAADVEQLTNLQRLELHDACIASTKGTDVMEAIWRMSPSAKKWVEISDRFVKSLALGSIAGYVVGLGRRNPTNILIRQKTGDVIHVNYSRLFECIDDENGVPFRTTRMLRNALDGANPFGLFLSTCEDVLSMLAEKETRLVAMTRTILYDAKPEDIERIRKKLSGEDEFVLEEGETAIDKKTQVTRLIEAASDPLRYGMNSFGWRSFW